MNDSWLNYNRAQSPNSPDLLCDLYGLFLDRTLWRRRRRAANNFSEIKERRQRKRIHVKLIFDLPDLRRMWMKWNLEKSDDSGWTRARSVETTRFSELLYSRLGFLLRVFCFVLLRVTEVDGSCGCWRRSSRWKLWPQAVACSVCSETQTVKHSDISLNWWASGSSARRDLQWEWVLVFVFPFILVLTAPLLFI